MRSRILLALCAAILLATCNKYKDYEVKTPVPPAPRQNN